MLKKGFTLIELMVTIAIVGVLASIVLISLNEARIRANVAKFEASAKSAQSAFMTECTGGSVLGHVHNVDLGSEITWGTNVTDCGDDGSFSVQLVPSTTSPCTDAVVDQYGATFNCP